MHKTPHQTQLSTPKRAQARPGAHSGHIVALGPAVSQPGPAVSQGPTVVSQPHAARPAAPAHPLRSVRASQACCRAPRACYRSPSLWRAPPAARLPASLRLPPACTRSPSTRTRLAPRGPACSLRASPPAQRLRLRPSA